MTSREKDTYLTRIWESSTGALALCTTGGIVVKVNRFFTELFLLSEEECEGEAIDGLLTPGIWSAEADSIRTMAAAGTPVALNTVRQNGRNELLQVFCTATLISDGKCGKNLLYIMKKIPSEFRKRLSDRMSDCEILSSAFVNSCEPSLITDSEGSILEVNSAFTKTFGWKLHEVKGTRPEELLIPESISPEAEYINAMVTAGRSIRLDTQRNTSTGGCERVALIASPMKNCNSCRIYRTAETSALTENSVASRNRFAGDPSPRSTSGMLFQCRTDRKRTMEFIARGTASFTGYSEEQFLSGEVSWSSLVENADREILMKTIQDSLVSAAEYSITYRIRSSSGQLLWVMEQGRAFRTGGDYTDFCEGNIVDLTGTGGTPVKEDSARERIERLHTVAGELQRSRSAGEIYRICAEAGQSILNGACSCIFLRSGDEMKIVASAGKDDYNCSGCRLGMAEVALNTSGPCYFQSRDRGEGFCPAGTGGICFKLGNNAVFQIMSRSSTMFGNVDTRIIELLLGYTEQGLKRINLQHQLINQALHDPLTGIYNRNYFNRLIELEEHRARRLDSSIGFIMVDVDNFKHINDMYGHQAGDRVLQQVAGVLSEALRNTDTVLRYGGDEFLIILTRMSSDYTHIVEDRIRTSMEKLGSPDQLKGERISVSMGHAFWTPEGTDTIDEILKLADMLMLRNKKRKP